MNIALRQHPNQTYLLEKLHRIAKLRDEFYDKLLTTAARTSLHERERASLPVPEERRCIEYPRKARLNAGFLDIAQVCSTMRESVPGMKQNPKCRDTK